LNRKVYGAALLILSIVLVLVYLIGLIIAPDTVIFDSITLSQILVRYTIFALILIIAAILAYTGFVIATSPNKPLDEILKEYREQVE